MLLSDGCCNVALFILNKAHCWSLSEFCEVQTLHRNRKQIFSSMFWRVFPTQTGFFSANVKIFQYSGYFLSIWMCKIKILHFMISLHYQRICGLFMKDGTKYFLISFSIAAVSLFLITELNEEGEYFETL